MNSIVGTLARVALCISAACAFTSANAVPTLRYQERITLGGTPWSGTSDPHSATASYSYDNHYLQYDGSPVDQIQHVDIANTPIPSIYVAVGARNYLGGVSASGGGTLYYEVGVQGTANSWVTVGFDAAYAMTGLNLLFPGVRRSSVSLEIITYDEYNSPIAFVRQCGESCSNTTAYVDPNKASLYFDLESSPFFETGLMHGSFKILIDDSGFSKFAVALAANAYQNNSVIDSPDFFNYTTAYIDPYFFTDASSNANLIFQNNIGNASLAAPSAVPEPASIVLSGIGIAALAVTRRRLVVKRFNR